MPFHLFTLPLQSKHNKQGMRRHFVHTLWLILILLISSTTVFFVSVWNGWVGYMPDMEELSNPVDKFASQVYSANGKLIGTWNQDNANRIPECS